MDDQITERTIILTSELWFQIFIIKISWNDRNPTKRISLGIARDEFLALCIALCFHQFFEGLGLGHVLYDASGKKKKILAIGSAIFYTLTTPAGVAIGIGMASVAENTASILAQGILDSISAGILIYSSLVSLMAIIFESKTFKKQDGISKFACFLCFYTGAALMSVLGIWA